MTMKPDGGGGGGVRRWGGTLAFGRRVKKEEEDREKVGGREGEREDIKKTSPRVSARLLSSCCS